MQSLGYWSKTLPISTKKNDGVPQAKKNHFANRSYQPRPKATTVQRHNLVTLSRPHKDKLSKHRKVNVGHHPEFIQRNWLTTVNAKEAEATKQAPIPAQPARAPPTQFPKCCAICTPLSKPCPNEYPITANWQDDLEEGQENQEQYKMKIIFCMLRFGHRFRRTGSEKSGDERIMTIRLPNQAPNLHQLATKSVHYQKWKIKNMIPS